MPPLRLGRCTHTDSADWTHAPGDGPTTRPANDTHPIKRFTACPCGPFSRVINEATSEMHGKDQQHTASHWHMRTRPQATFIREGVAIAFAEHLMKGGGPSVVAAERAPLIRPLRLQPGVLPRVLLDNRPTLQAHGLELGFGRRQHARFEVGVLLCARAVGGGGGSTCGHGAACELGCVRALSSLMNFSLRLVCTSPSMRLMNSAAVDIVRGCISSIWLRSRLSPPARPGRESNERSKQTDRCKFGWGVNQRTQSSVRSEFSGARLCSRARW